MPGLIFHVGATAICPHAGQISVISTNSRVMVSGQPVATMGDTFLVSGCGAENTCVKVQSWLAPATRVQVNGQAVILQTSSGVCQNAAPVNVLTLQTRVQGT